MKKVAYLRYGDLKKLFLNRIFSKLLLRIFFIKPEIQQIFDLITQDLVYPRE
jgi:hypothetical protein